MSFLKPHPEGTLIFLRVVPRASRNEIGEIVGDELKLRVTAPPVDSAANRAVVEFLAERLGLGKSGVVLLRGETSRRKMVLARGLSLENVAAALRCA